jgi:HAD superfamily hydrolase (TIGR01459 family)
MNFPSCLPDFPFSHAARDRRGRTTVCGDQMRRIYGLSELTDGYDALLCDVWGVLHNGIAAFPAAVDAIRRFRVEIGPVVLITNAPRPAGPIRDQLRRLGVPEDTYDAVITSGDVTREVVAERPGARVFHLGTDRDLSFYEGLDITLVPEAEAELVSCTGLFDDTAETPEHYRELLARFASRDLVMVCANPDLVVERGHLLVYCAGALARLYAEIGGTAILVGKPHAPIYDAAKRRLADLGGTKLLAVGDGLPTDIRGAVDNDVDALFITGGIHAADFGPVGDPDGERVAARLKAEGLQAVAYMPAFGWSASP